MKEQLINFYLEYVNDFVTVSGMADYYGYTGDEVRIMIEAGKELHERSLSQKE